DRPSGWLGGGGGGRGDPRVGFGVSIAGGMGGNTAPWPVVFEKETGVRVVNLARPGIGTAEAIALAKEVSAGDELVVIEIGGNDLLANVPGEEFGRELEGLVGMLDRPGRRLVMFELPLLVHKIEYGRVQRRVAAAHHVVLVPKRFFVGVIGGEGATEDGLHLSGRGAERMCGVVRRVVGKAVGVGAK
ncbi:MAG: SGNH/GDSL hydrolase family protein, partial [Phycisphaerae bacterium]